jgi:hypothetical protein
MFLHKLEVPEVFHNSLQPLPEGEEIHMFHHHHPTTIIIIIMIIFS